MVLVSFHSNRTLREWVTSFMVRMTIKNKKQYKLLLFLRGCPIAEDTIHLDPWAGTKPPAGFHCAEGAGHTLLRQKTHQQSYLVSSVNYDINLPGQIMLICAKAAWLLQGKQLLSYGICSPLYSRESIPGTEKLLKNPQPGRSEALILLFS